MSSSKVFLVTGTSSGFGNELVKIILKNGHKAVATSRKPEELKFEGATDDNLLTVKCDVTDDESVAEAFKKAVEKFGRVDVVVNNAGYGLAGTFESYEEKQIRMQMEINFFGLIKVTKKALEVMREQKPAGGLIQQVTSIGGQRGVPYFSSYCASKWAVEGLTEAISKELKPEWNIKLTCVEPGGFRTEWAGNSMVFAKPHSAYDHVDPEGDMKKKNGTQAGEPVKGAQAMYDLAMLSDPPLRTVIGSDASAAMDEKLKLYKENYQGREDLKKIAMSCDVDEEKK